MKLAIVGHSDSGKTSIITTVVEGLRESGISVATVKHAHGAHSLFPEGKDTSLHLQAGADPVIGVSSDEMAVYLPRTMDLEGTLGLLAAISSPDVVLVEGFKNSTLPKVVLGGIEAAEPILLRGRDTEEVVADILGLINREVNMERVMYQLPGLDCEKCGYSTCRELAEAIIDGDKGTDDCRNRPQEGISIRVNGEKVPVGGFVSEFVSNTVWGMISSLKGVEDIRTIHISIEEK